MSDQIRFKDGGVTFPPGTMIGDLTVEQFSKWWGLVVTQPMLATLPAQADATATKAGPGPKLTPADPLDADLERVRLAVVEAAQKLGDATIGKELQAFAGRLRQLAGISAPTAAGSRTDTEKAAAPVGPFDAFVQAFKAPASAASPNVFADTFGWAEVERK